MTDKEFKEMIGKMFHEKREPKKNWTAFDIYEYIKGVRNDNIYNDMALDACMTAERMFNANNCY